MHDITVRPCSGSKGWVIEQAMAQPMRFLSGSTAETSARALVLRLAQAGRPARATVWLRDGSMAGQITAF